MKRKQTKVPQCRSRDAVGCQCVRLQGHVGAHTSKAGDARFSWPRGAHCRREAHTTGPIAGCGCSMCERLREQRGEPTRCSSKRT